MEESRKKLKKSSNPPLAKNNKNTKSIF